VGWKEPSVLPLKEREGGSPSCDRRETEEKKKNELKGKEKFVFFRLGTNAQIHLAADGSRRYPFKGLCRVSPLTTLQFFFSVSTQVEIQKTGATLFKFLKLNRNFKNLRSFSTA
jgi:hypothetical protein